MSGGLPARVASAIRAASLSVLVAGCSGERWPAGPRVADGRIVATSDSTFVRDVIEPGQATVVYYWAQACMPCYVVAPKLAKVAARYAGRVTFWKMNMGWSARRVRLYGIRACQRWRSTSATAKS